MKVNYPNEFVKKQVEGLQECREAWPDQFGDKEKALAFQLEFMQEFQYTEAQIKEVMDFLEKNL